MILSLFKSLSHALESTPSFAIGAAFCWGCLSILLSPCHLASIPLIIGFLTDKGTISLRRAFSITVLFSVGILLTIGIIGAITASIGRMLGDIGRWGNSLVGGILIFIALYLFGLLRIPWFSGGGNSVFLNKKGYIGAFLIGIFFGFALGPCTFAYLAPVLGLVFRISATHMIYGITLIFAYAVGHCAVIVAAGILYEKLQHYLNWVSDSKSARVLKLACGALVLVAAAYLIYTSLNI